MTRTSETHPLRIDCVKIDQVLGEIGMTFCPGKKQPNAKSGTWDRDLSKDMAAIADCGAKAILTLMEAEELVALGVPADRLEQASMAHDIDWYHLPIRDVSIPDGVFESAWSYAGIKLRKLLAGGNRVVLHCKGGLGRTGTIAARLLIEFGEDAESAIARIRASRSGAIETREQEEYVRQCRSFGEPHHPISTSERAWACLLGGAIGDAFGYEVEFDHWPDIKQRFGDEGIREPELHDGKLVVSDDTQMTLFTLEGMLLAASKGEGTETLLNSIRESYLDWYGTQFGRESDRKPAGTLANAPVMRMSQAPGATCLSALGSGGQGTPKQPINNSKGCGGVMRVAPIGWLGRLTGREVFEIGAQTAALTHGHPTGYLASGLMASIVHSLMTAEILPEAVDRALPYLEAWPDHQETLAAVNRALGLAKDESLSTYQAVSQLGQGWIAEEALAIGLYAALKGEDFESVLAIAANHSGDSDSTASIAGQLWGARRGLEGIPQGWIQSLDVYQPLTRLASQSCSLWQ